MPIINETLTIALPLVAWATSLSTFAQNERLS